jgi:hypothetical protein
MNIIGIDYQQTHSVICLREGGAITSHPDSVGDGLRHLIPNAVFQDGVWGSRAMLRTDAGRIAGDALSGNGPWLAAPAAILWQGMRDRLYSYLGRMNPGPENGYQVVVGIQALNQEESAAAVKRLCSGAGLEETTVVAATHALLCRWMAEAASNPNNHPTVIAVAVGDSSTTVTAYRVRMSSGLYPFVTSVSRTIYLGNGGHLLWTAKTIDLVQARFREHFDEFLPPGYDLNMRDAVLRFAAQLSRAEANQQIEWTGLFREKLYSTFRLARKECERWPEVVAFRQSLSAAIADAAGEVCRNREPEVIAVGGVGAIWPFATDLASTSKALVWRSESPQEDVACGAAWWPEAGERSAEVLSTGGPPVRGSVLRPGDDGQEDSIEEGADDRLLTDEVTEEIVDTKIVPPWER